jgi:hypothetical protein
MIVIIQGPIGRRRFFALLGLAMLGSLYAALTCTGEDDVALSVSAFAFFAYLTGISALLVYKPGHVDSLIGRAACPYCKQSTWSLSDILRISRWTTVRCRHCNYPAKARIWWFLLFALALPLWLASLVVLGSVTWPFLIVATYGLAWLYLGVRSPSLK